jgi:hypothetical protein
MPERHRESGVNIHLFLNSVLVGSYWIAYAPAAIPQGKQLPALDGPENRSGRLEEEKNFFVLPGNEMCLSFFLL